jgi:anti-sigma B factor antagonist
VQIAIRKLDQITIVDAVGDIDYSTSPELRKVLLREFCELKIPRVALNLTSVQYVDSSGVASLLEGLKASRDLKSRFILYGVNAKVTQVLQLSRLLTVFEICENEEQALKP